jgi:hypothetical protein
MNNYISKIFENFNVLSKNYTKVISAAKNSGSTCDLLLLDYKDEALGIFWRENEKILRELGDDFNEIEYLKVAFELSKIEWFCFCVSFFCSVYTEFKKNAEFSPINGVNPYICFSIRLFEFSFNVNEIKDFYKIVSHLESHMNKLFLDPEGEISKRFRNFILIGAESSGLEYNFVETIFPNNNNKIKSVYYEIVKKITEIIKNKKNIYFEIHAPHGCGKKTAEKCVCYELGIPIIIIDCEKAADSRNPIYAVKECMREALLLCGALCFDGFESLGNEKYFDLFDFILRYAGDFSSTVFLNLNKKIKIKSKNIIKINLIELSIEQKGKIWNEIFDKIGFKVDGEKMSGIFPFSPGRINECAEAFKNMRTWNPKASERELLECIRNSVDVNFGGNARRITAKHIWEDLIIGEAEKQILLSACAQVKYRNLVFGKWEMGKRVVYGDGLSLLFSGPPGTGKTMAASVMANELGLDIFRVDLSRVVSKYIGETEKNLSLIFDEAKRGGAMLLFDETDALFSKRTESKDSHDRSANMEISFLLQKMEEHSGICIMTTNFLENIDKAFFRRITYVVHFALPDILEREKIWQGMFTKKTPLENGIDFKFLSKFEISGGNIKNASVAAAFMAAKDCGKIKMKHILRALEYELKKQGQNILRSDFGEYAYFL